MNKTRTPLLLAVAALAAGDARHQVVESKVKEGVHCAEFATGLMHHLNKMGVKE